jgi:hypothetical protein
MTSDDVNCSNWARAIERKIFRASDNGELRSTRGIGGFLKNGPYKLRFLPYKFLDPKFRPKILRKINK